MKTVIQYDLNGKVLKIYNSIIEAAEKTSISRRSISNCCNRKQYTAGGFQWRHYDNFNNLEPLPPINIYSTSKPVNQYTIDGILVNTYRSINEASRITHINDKSISWCCNGKARTAGHYIWKFANGDTNE